MFKLSEQINKIALVIGSIVFLITTAFGVNAYFAKSDELEALRNKTSAEIAFLGDSFKLDQVQRRVESYQERIWKIEDRLNGGKKISVDEKKILQDQKRRIEQDKQKLEQDKQIIEKKLDNTIKKS